MKQIPVECYSRVCGFFRPVQAFNLGKKEEFNERVTFNLDKIKEAIGHEDRSQQV